MRLSPITTFLLGLLISIIFPLGLLHIPALEKITTLDLLAYVTGFTSMIGAVLITYLGALSRDVDTSHTEIKDEITHLTGVMRDNTEILAYTTDHEGTYEKLRYYVMRANTRVDLMYFGVRPPSAYIKSLSKENYVSELDKSIKERKKNFRRIILYTEENKEWIKTIIKAHKGNEWFSLAVVINPEALPILSAQVIDDDIAIFMNLDSAITPKKPRDIIFESKIVAGIVDLYYASLFAKARIIVENGKIIGNNYKELLGGGLIR